MTNGETPFAEEGHVIQSKAIKVINGPCCKIVWSTIYSLIFSLKPAVWPNCLRVIEVLIETHWKTQNMQKGLKISDR